MIVGGRRLLGQPSVAEFVRQGIRWRLDLREGIDFSIFLLGAFEPSMVRAYGNLVTAGQTVLDIGANVGAHTLPLAKLVGHGGRVVSFEPTAFAFRKCAVNVALNPDLAPRITMLQTMLVATEADSMPASVFSSWPLVAGDDLHETHRGRRMGTDGGKAATLDRTVEELKLSRVDFIKLDVDGAECAVLAGGLGMLREFRPTIALELAPYIHTEQGHTFDELIGIIHDIGYHFSDVSTGRKIPADPAFLRRAIPEGGMMNVLARSELRPPRVRDHRG